MRDGLLEREAGGGEAAAGLDVVSLYRQHLARRGFVSDEAQWRAVERLQRLYEEWTAYKARRSTALRRLLVKPALPKGVYLWGGVGRGKSFLMDAFYLCVPLVRKRRVHFHHFMREIHRELDALRGEEDPIAKLAERTARRYRLVCFDEFHVSDIADAMILGRYLQHVTERGVEFVMTSNTHPDQLYAAGLQRERFLPAIELLKSRLDVLQVDNGTDYRRLKMEKLKVYHAPLDAAAERALSEVFESVADVEDEHHGLDVEGRRIPFRRRAGGVVWFDFAALCGGPRSYADYVDLARRFTWLIDVLYDDRVNLVVSAEAQPEALFAEGTQSAEFARTASRLHEMQSLDYLGSERARR